MPRGERVVEITQHRIQSIGLQAQATATAYDHLSGPGRARILGGEIEDVGLAFERSRLNFSLFEKSAPLCDTVVAPVSCACYAFET